MKLMGVAKREPVSVDVFYCVVVRVKCEGDWNFMPDDFSSVTFVVLTADQ